MFYLYKLEGEYIYLCYAKMASKSLDDDGIDLSDFRLYCQEMDCDYNGSDYENCCNENACYKKLDSTSTCSTDGCEESEDEDITVEVYPNFVKTFQNIENEDLVCLICQMVAINPMQSHCCGKIYCQNCINKFKKRNPVPKCPTCRKAGVQFFEDKRASRAILGLMVYCTRRSKGCKWQGSFSDMATHLDKCNHRLVICSNGCDKTMKHFQLAKHITRSCPNRDFNCSNCGESGKWSFITKEHVMVCKDKPFVCTNDGCGEKIKRCNRVSHQSVCPKKIVQCNYKDMGCAEMFKREDTSKHDKSNKRRHFQYALEKARRPFLQKGHLHQVAPVVLTVDSFEKQNTLRSLPFFSSVGGYKMSLVVRKVNGYMLGIFICMMPGEHDQSLQWPFEGNITVELMNQLKDENHLTFSADMFVVKDSYYTTKDEMSEYYKGIEIGSYAFKNNDCIPVTGIDPSLGEFHNFVQKGYLANDCLYFRVSCIDNND